MGAGVEDERALKGQFGGMTLLRMRCWPIATAAVLAVTVSRPPGRFPFLRCASAVGQPRRAQGWGSPLAWVLIVSPRGSLMAACAYTALGITHAASTTSEEMASIACQRSVNGDHAPGRPARALPSQTATTVHLISCEEATQ
jgi:hypothetical protein